MQHFIKFLPSEFLYTDCLFVYLTQLCQLHGVKQQKQRQWQTTLGYYPSFCTGNYEKLWKSLSSWSFWSEI